MNKERFWKVMMIILLMVLILDLGSRALLRPSEVSATSNFQYTTELVGPRMSRQEFAALCNNMASKSWRYVETNTQFDRWFAVFEKQ